jgi:hypothetical protein
MAEIAMAQTQIIVRFVRVSPGQTPILPRRVPRRLFADALLLAFAAIEGRRVVL